MDNTQFIAERISRTATILLHGPVDSVFPLFGAYEEKSWAEGWMPEPVYPQSERMEEGIVFKSIGHSHGEPKNIWTVSKYQPDKHLVQYTVMAFDRLVVITVSCGPASPNTTSAVITYTMTGLTEKGNAQIPHLIAKMFEQELGDWEEAINLRIKNSALAESPSAPHHSQ